MPNYIPARSHILWINFDPHAGHEQMGRRPALVLSPQMYNEKTGLAILCPITAAIKGYPFEVKLPENLPVSGVILTDQLKSLDWNSRKAEYCCNLNKQIFNEVIEKIKLLIY